MAYENNDKKMESVYSQRIRAGKRRTYFFDVRETRGNDFYLTITESRKKFNEDGYDRHKIFLYKEDFNKFLKGMTEAIDFVKTELMPDFDFDAFNHEGNEPYDGQGYTPGKEAIANDASNDASADADEAPTGIAAAATPEIDSAPTAPAAEPETPASASEDAATEEPLDTSHRDEEVDKW